MNPNPEWMAEVDENGRLVLPPELMNRYGLIPGVRVRIDPDTNQVRLRRPVTQLIKVYVEPTSRCNLNCTTCMRNAWEESLGTMSDGVWNRVLGGLSRFPNPLTLFFGGFGEPLSHPHIVAMVLAAKAQGASVELITNGTLLRPSLAQELIDAGLDVLWVSLDGATSDSYADVRLGAELPGVMENLTQLRDLRIRAGHRPELGIAFVAMKRNLAELPQVLRLGRGLGATRFSVTNLLPHTQELSSEVLYERTVTEQTDVSGPSGLPFDLQLSLPRMDLDERTRVPLYHAVRAAPHVSWPGTGPGLANNCCPFIEGGMMAVAWTGDVSPCLPLMHSYMTFIGDREHFSHRYAVGNAAEQDLFELWNSPEYVAFRQRVQTFDFAPCLPCGGCDQFEKNEEDCFGNTFPTCGGCLWAQGLIQCP